jgi:hypothetical protein
MGADKLCATLDSKVEPWERDDDPMFVPVAEGNPGTCFWRKRLDERVIDGVLVSVETVPEVMLPGSREAKLRLSGGTRTGLMKRASPRLLPLEAASSNGAGSTMI